MKTYAICGSMRFAREMQDIAYQLITQKGYNILQCAYNIHGQPVNENELQNLQAAHFKRIDMSDGIYVVNIGGYIGMNTSEEIAYAKAKNKEIIYHENQEN